MTEKKNKFIEQLLKKSIEKALPKNCWHTQLLLKCKDCHQIFSYTISLSLDVEKKETNVVVKCHHCQSNDYYYFAGVDRVSKGNFNQNFNDIRNENSA